jgi:hypothetical protein
MQVPRPTLTGWKRRISTGLAAAFVAPMILIAVGGTAQAANSEGCEGGGFRLLNLGTAAVVAPRAPATTVDATLAAGAFGTTIGVRGKYAQFDIRLSDFAVLNQAFTGAPNALDITGGRFTPVFASKVPDLKGATLTSGIAVGLSGENLEISRTGTGVSMKIQAKDCAQGGIFQMEPQRSDGTVTRITHTLATSETPEMTPFYFDNPNFRARIGQFLGDDCTSVTTGPPSKFCVQVTARVNIANGFSRRFVVRDSSQVATRVPQPACNTATPITPSVRHCGGVSIWDVASGGRMGFVTGEDSVEVANPPTNCTHQCKAQNQVRGRLVVLGFPFPVPAGSKLTPRFP